MVRDAHLAEDVTQSAFVALAQNARQLTERPVLSGWLHRTAQNIAANAVRSDVRRRDRDQEAAAMNDLLANEPDLSRRNGTEADDWEHIAPLLDAALGELSEPDRDALLLRYFERKSAREMAQTLGISDDAAQKRVSRAVERLRQFFAKRGVTAGASGLAVVISANAVQAAPAGLAVTISTAAALVETTLATTTTATAIKTIARTILQKTVIIATIAAATGAGLYQTRQAAALRDQMQTLQQHQASLAAQLTELKSDNESLSNRLAQANPSPSLSSERLRELLRLRGEVGVLRRQQRELEQAAAAAKSKAGGTPAQPTQVATPQSNMPAPFQLQLVLDEPGENTEPMTNNSGGETLHVQKTPLMDYTAIRSASVSTNMSSGAAQIDIEFSDVGKELLRRLQRRTSTNAWPLFWTAICIPRR